MAHPHIQTPEERLIEAMDRIRLSRSLRGHVCPACGGIKEEGKPFCKRDWSKLPAELHQLLEEEIGLGYVRAMLLAMLRLNALEFYEIASAVPHVKGLPRQS